MRNEIWHVWTFLKIEARELVNGSPRREIDYAARKHDGSFDRELKGEFADHYMLACEAVGAWG